ncbi:hypothetical protein L596_022264 [Steinernema carpocapsae]|uniref:TGF-beta family profile domain-containing protein n=1 Tax=Steinernema carpocapsae TaxID=34508 RepID=A0A4U5MM24_STECR|nr:hypothetical protein L596_022264 [Steinernema carpocapsae]
MTSATACRLAPYDDVTSDTEVIVHYGSNWRSERSQPANGPKADQPVGARRSRGFVCSNLLNSLFLILALACLPSLVMAAKPNRFTDEQIRELQAAFRTRLNLPEPPLSFKTTPAQIPPYMWDIYRDAQADIVRHFYPIRITSNHRGFLLTYDLKVANNKPSEERVVRAELKLQLAPFSEKGVYVDVYAVDENSNEMREPVDSRFTLPSNRSHWIDLDVLEVFQKSTGDGQLVEMFVEVEPINTAISSRSAALVVYFESDAPGAAEHRKKRSVRHANRHKKKHKLHGNRKLCKREPLSVSFTELNWNYFIVAPHFKVSQVHNISELFQVLNYVIGISNPLLRSVPMPRGMPLPNPISFERHQSRDHPIAGPLHRPELCAISLLRSSRTRRIDHPLLGPQRRYHNEKILRYGRQELWMQIVLSERAKVARLDACVVISRTENSPPHICFANLPVTHARQRPRPSFLYLPTTPPNYRNP